MNKAMTIDQFWKELKQRDENSKRTIEAAEKTIDIINKIINARNKLNLTQRELAKRCGIKQPALARIETFKTIPKINTLIKIADCVNVSIDALDSEQRNNVIKAQQIAFFVMGKLNYATVDEGVYKYANTSY